MLKILLISALAGVVGTGLGGAAGALYKPRSNAGTGLMLSFASGIMAGLVFFSIIPESLELAGVWIVVAALAIGAALAFFANHILDHASGTPHSHIPQASSEPPGTELSGRGSAAALDTDRNTTLFLAAAIALHNFPEGLALGSGAELDIRLGVVWAVLITLHNIPVGIAIGVSSVAEGKSRPRGLLTAMLSGVPMVIGTAIGAAFGNAGSLFLGAVFAVSGGALLYVDFCEIIPQVIRSGKNIRTGFVILIGALTTLLTVYLLEF